jgi:hypothetical protein
MAGPEADDSLIVLLLQSSYIFVAVSLNPDWFF